MQSLTDRSIGVLLVLTDVPLLHKTTAFGDLINLYIDVIALQAARDAHSDARK